MTQQITLNNLEVINEVIRINQIVTETNHPRINIKSPEDVVEIIQKEIAYEDREVLLVLCLNSKNQVNAIHRSHVGSLNASLAHPREIFKAAILNNSASIIISHQHPSMDCSPSRQDKEVTKRIADAGELLGIELLDSLVISPSSYYSFKENGHI